MTANMLDVSVKFGGVSIGKNTANISMKIERDESIGLLKAEESFCGRRLTGRIVLGGGNDTAGQKKLIETDLELEGSFDVHRFGVTPEEFTIGATFAKSEIDLSILGDFSNGSGRIVVESIKLIPADIVEEKTEKSGSLPGTYADDGPWKEFSLDGLFEGGILKSMKKAGLETVGDLHGFQQPDKNGYTKNLTDIPGIGASKAQLIEDKMIEFWRDNPQEDN